MEMTAARTAYLVCHTELLEVEVTALGLQRNSNDHAMGLARTDRQEDRQADRPVSGGDDSSKNSGITMFVVLVWHGQTEKRQTDRQANRHTDRPVTGVGESGSSHSGAARVNSLVCSHL